MIDKYNVTKGYDSELTAPVALLFFTRTRTLIKTFSQIKKARPSRLFLIQDGPRADHPEDIKLREECRSIVSDIDWKCEVNRNYSDVNLGTAVRPFSGFSWVFDNADRAIILEDDCYPNQCFFKYCEILLDKYFYDERINMITGYNFFDKMKNIQESYFFEKSGTNWGVAHMGTQLEAC